MTPELEQALAGLRDLQLDHGSGHGFMAHAVVAVLVVLALLAAIYFWHRPRQKYLRQLDAALKIYRASGQASQDATQAVVVAAGVLRDAAYRLGREPMGQGVAGEMFLNWLDARAPKQDRGAFSQGIGRMLIRLPFQRPDLAAGEGRGELEVDALLALAARWVKANA